MRPLRDALAALPAAGRRTLLGAGACVLALLVGAAVWAFLGYRAAGADRALAQASATYRQAMAGSDPAPLDTAAEALRRALREHPRARGAAVAWYELGNVEYRRQAYDAALAAFEGAASRDRGSIGGLSRLALGYTWEAKGDLGKALEAYRAALGDRRPTDFLFGEALLGTARAQEGLKQPGAAIDTYKRFLKEIPASTRSDEVRDRLAILGAGA